RSRGPGVDLRLVRLVVARLVDGAWALARAQDRVDLVLEPASGGCAAEPFEPWPVDARDLPERPALVAPEAGQRPARRARGRAGVVLRAGCLTARRCRRRGVGPVRARSGGCGGRGRGGGW